MIVIVKPVAQKTWAMKLEIKEVRYPQERNHGREARTLMHFSCEADRGVS
jgi:hypothetical protein